MSTSKLFALYILSTLVLQSTFTSTSVQAKEKVKLSCPTTQALVAEYNSVQNKLGLMKFKIDKDIPLERQYKNIVTVQLYRPNPDESLGSLLYITYTVTVPANISARAARLELVKVADNGDDFIVKVPLASTNVKLLFKSRATQFKDKCVIDVTEAQYLRNR